MNNDRDDSQKQQPASARTADPKASTAPLLGPPKGQPPSLQLNPRTEDLLRALLAVADSLRKEPECQVIPHPAAQVGEVRIQTQCKRCGRGLALEQKYDLVERVNVVTLIVEPCPCADEPARSTSPDQLELKIDGAPRLRIVCSPDVTIPAADTEEDGPEQEA